MYENLSDYTRIKKGQAFHKIAYNNNSQTYFFQVEKGFFMLIFLIKKKLFEKYLLWEFFLIIKENYLHILEITKMKINNQGKSFDN